MPGKPPLQLLLLQPMLQAYSQLHTVMEQSIVIKPVTEQHRRSP